MIGALAMRLGFSERPQRRGEIADHRQGIGVPGPLRLGVDDVGDRGVAEAPESEPEVEWRPEHDDHVGTLLEQSTRAQEGELVIGRQGPAAEPVS